MKDEELILAITKGEKDKYREIVERYEKKLKSYIWSLTNQEMAEVEDLVQEVFVSAYQNLEAFDTKKQFSSWIYRIAHNKAVDFFKKHRRRREQIEDQEEILPNKEKLLEDLEVEKEERKEVKRAVESLEAKYKEIILLFYYEEKNYEEISEILRIPTNNVGVLLFRAKKILKEKLVKKQKTENQNLLKLIKFIKQ